MSSLPFTQNALAVMRFGDRLRALIWATHLLPLVAAVSEADYTLDDSFWNEESPVGEVERLLKEYRENQELVRRIGGHYYQIIYPVQLRHHEKMGISTREVSAAKSGQRQGRPHDSADGGFSRARTRTGKHFHRTSLLIKAFNHKFRLDLELNSQLLAPNIQQKHFHTGGYQVDGNRHDIEHCYYHGTVKDYPGASAAFHTCNGVSGVIHVGNETFVIHPFYGGDLSQKHPHVIFEARTKANKGCANTGHMKWRNVRRLKSSVSEIVEESHSKGAARYKRDVREATKYIETAIFVDKAMFEKRNGSTRAQVIHDAIQVANIADLYFRTLNTRVSVVYIETWGKNQIAVNTTNISQTLTRLNDYAQRYTINKVERDTTQLLTGETFAGGEAGMAVPDTVCTPRAVGISVDINVYEPHLLAGTMAHMIGHNIGMGHDDGREECFCRDWHGCIMAQSIVGLENVQPYKFSECSKTDYFDALRGGHGLCLLNKPNEIEMNRNCGNKIVEDDEECDCGSTEECLKDPCCDPITCKLKLESQCAEGPCCENCKLKQQGVMCRDSTNECDLPEYCDGQTGECPADVFKKNGSPCGTSKSGVSGYCFQGNCPTLSLQCEAIWGYGSTAADHQCYEQFNTKGSPNGHCGVDNYINYIKCAPENILCGSLQCKEGERQPPGFDDPSQLILRTIVSIKGVEYECKTNNGKIGSSEFPEHGLVKDGTPCGENLICVNRTCVSLFPHIDQTKCPSNKMGYECSDHGVCTNMNSCFCDVGWGGLDCSIPIALTTTTTAAPSGTTQGSSIKMEKKETAYGDGDQDKISTLTMVIILVVIVKCVFISFATIAVCYRRKTTRLKYDQPYNKKPIAKAYGGTVTTANHTSVEEVSLDGSNKMTGYGNQTAYRDHKLQQIIRMAGSGSEEDQTVTEKGILKKHGYGLMLGEQMKDKWGEDDQSDNLELMAQQDGTLVSGAAASEVERTLKSLNGYHEDILEALRNAAHSHRGTGAGNTPVGSGSLSEEMLRKTLQEHTTAALGYSEYKARPSSKASSKENVCDVTQPHTVLVEGSVPQGAILHHHRPQHLQDDEEQPATGPLRIRNLEDLIRQLEHHSSRHMSPSGSEDIRMSETEADRHYRLDSSAACSESSQGSNQQLAQSQKTATILPAYSSRCRPRSDDESRFVYGRYRHPTTSRHPHQSHSPHAFGHHAHHSHAHGHQSHGPHSSHHSSHTRLHQDDEGIYESADHHDRNLDPRLNRETPDSESDDFIQAQQQLARWASEDVVSVVVQDPGTSSDIHPHQGVGTSSTAGIIHGETASMNATTNGLNVGPREYYPSPPSTETESSGSVIQPQQRRSHLDTGHGDGQLMENGRYPEYKH